MLQLNHETSKNDRPTKRFMAGHKGTPPVQLSMYMGRTEETIQQEKPIYTTQTWEKLNE